MRKIDKTFILSVKYKTWEEEFEDNQSPHKKYSPSDKFYYDVAMNLLLCQNGLCAYTEVQLCPGEDLTINNWVDGRYNFTTKKFNGELDHFDESLKSKKNDQNGIKDWLWDNLFMVDSDTNLRKGTKAVDPILKPDGINYDEFALLDYNFDTHQYAANLDKSEDEITRIDRMINEVLGINFPNLVDKRRVLITKAMEYGTFDFENEFPTAFEFYKRKKSIK